MLVVDTSASMRAASENARRVGSRIGFVPTMGYLHDGHLALVECARASCDVVVASIFVNPAQFAPGEDLSSYPRDPNGDRRKLEDWGCDVLFQPISAEVYPESFSTFVVVDRVSSLYEGASRPTHFRGVATVVAKLFNIVNPHVAVFGQKDAQQVAVIRRMIADLNLDVELDVVATVREEDGLARSSRNVYLSEDERRRATALHRALIASVDAAASGATLEQARSVLIAGMMHEVDSIDYADIVNGVTFEPAMHPREDSLLAIVAARFGKTRLIDNMTVHFDRALQNSATP